MMRGDYDPAIMKVEIWQKDMKIISEFAAAVLETRQLILQRLGKSK